MKKALIFLLVLQAFAGLAQNYSTKKIIEYRNGEASEMKGVPGDLFHTIITFSNHTAGVVSVQVDRYKKTVPSYWAVCYCYIQCHSPKEDSVVVTIQPFSTEDLTIQYKTDSVNPGITYTDFRLNEVGSSSTKTISLTASTLLDVGLAENARANKFSVYPNPADHMLNIETGEDVIELTITDLGGRTLKHWNLDAGRLQELDVSGFEQGLYHLIVKTQNGTFNRAFVKSK